MRIYDTMCLKQLLKRYFMRLKNMSIEKIKEIYGDFLIQSLNAPRINEIDIVVMENIFDELVRRIEVAEGKDV